MKTDFYWEALVYWGAYLKNIFLSSAPFWNSKLMTTLSWEHSLGPKIKNKKPTTSKNSNCCDQSTEDRSQNASFLFQVVFLSILFQSDETLIQNHTFILFVFLVPFYFLYFSMSLSLSLSLSFSVSLCLSRSSFLTFVPDNSAERFSSCMRSQTLNLKVVKVVQNTKTTIYFCYFKVLSLKYYAMIAHTDQYDKDWKSIKIRIMLWFLGAMWRERLS